MSVSAVLVRDVEQQIRVGRNARLVACMVVLGVAAMIALVAGRRAAQPFLGTTLGVFALVLVGWILRPRTTLYATLVFTAVSDIVTVSWFPFAKNFSSRESISYISDALTISPLDITLAAGFAVTAVRSYASTRRLLPRLRLDRAVIAVSLFVVWGFIKGVAVGGGDLRIAVLEGRAMFYLPLMYVIVGNVCTESIHFRRALWWLLTGIVVQVLLSIEFLSRLDPARRGSLESLNEHGSGIGHNMVLLALACMIAFRARAPIAKLCLAIASVPTAYVYLVAQRRSAVAGLAVALIVLLVGLYWKRRRAFWIIAPIVLVGSLGYLAAFWNSSSSAAFPAQAIKTAVAPESASAEDQSSDLYRTIETYDLVATIRTQPLPGLGFGQPFLRPVPLPYLPNFELAAYQPHNSILWLWIKVGFVGFAAMFYLVGRAVMLGGSRVRESEDALDVALFMAATLFVVMYFVYTFVDVSWDARNMVFLGFAIAFCARTDGTDLVP